MITDSELYWLAGLLEGEGHFTYAKGTQVISLEMTDEEIVERVSRLYTKITDTKFEVYCRIRKEKNRNLTYQLNATGNNARVIMRAVVRLMGYRRRTQIWQSLNEFKPILIKIDIEKLFGP